MTDAERKDGRDEVAAPKNSGGDSAGRGGLFVLGAKVYFVLTGLVQQVVLPRVIGLDGYGELARIMAVGNVVNNVVVSGSVQAASRTVASAGPRGWEAVRGSLRLHVPLAALVAILLLAATPAVAAFEDAPYVKGPLFVMAGVTFFYGLYAPMVGAINGFGRFGAQARLDATFATLRTLGLVGVGYGAQRVFREGVLGVALGFVLATVVIVVLAWRVLGNTRRDVLAAALLPSDPASVVAARPYLALVSSLALAQLFTNLVMQSDITLLGRFASLGAATTGLEPGLATKAANEWVGVYRACQLFAFLPYQLVMSITQVLFPMLARARAAGDHEAVRKYVMQGARLGAAGTAILVFVIVLLPGSLLGLAFSRDVAERGAGTLRILAVGQGAFTLFGIAASVLASLGRERIAATFAGIAFVLTCVLAFAFAANAPFGEPQLVRTAAATSLALVLALVAASAAVHRTAGGFLPPKTIGIVVAMVAGAALVGTHVPRFGRIATLGLAPLAAASAALLLVVTREIDPRAMKRDLSKRT